MTSNAQLSALVSGAILFTKAVHALEVFWSRRRKTTRNHLVTRKGLTSVNFTLLPTNAMGRFNLPTRAKHVVLCTAITTFLTVRVVSSTRMTTGPGKPPRRAGQHRRHRIASERRETGRRDWPVQLYVAAHDE